MSDQRSAMDIKLIAIFNKLRYLSLKNLMLCLVASKLNQGSPYSDVFD